MCNSDQLLCCDSNDRSIKYRCEKSEYIQYLTKVSTPLTFQQKKKSRISQGTILHKWNLDQGSRVRPIWSHVWPNFSRVRLKKIWGCTGASSHSRKEKKDHQTLGSYRGLNQSEIVKGGPPSDWPWSRYSCTCVYVWRCVCCCSHTEIEVSSRDARSSFSQSALFSERLTVPPGFCDRWIYRKIKQTPLFSKLPQILRLDSSCDVIAMRIQSKKGYSVPKME